MTTPVCPVCGRPLSTDPNERENVFPCRLCTAVLCSEACLADHERAAHPDEVVVAEDDEEA